MKLTKNSDINLAGVMGFPIIHSRSPLMHNTMMTENKIRGAYVPLEIKPGTLTLALEALPKLGFKGVNLTIPLKQEAISVVDELDPVGRLIGAVSCVVVREDDSLFGVNNDWIGFRDNLDDAYPDWRSETHNAMVIGAGGGSRAIVYALIEAGIEQIYLVNRTQGHAKTIAAIFKDHHVNIYPWEDLNDLVPKADLIINTTNQGMVGQPALPISLETAQPSTFVTDIIYTPLETPLIQAAKTRGLRTLGGLGMLLHQSRPAWRMWFGIDPVITEKMRHLMTQDILNELGS